MFFVIFFYNITNILLIYNVQKYKEKRRIKKENNSIGAKLQLTKGTPAYAFVPFVII